MLDNVANLLLTAGLLAQVFGFPTKFVLQFMVPGTALGVLVGDLIFTWMAFRLAKKLGRPDITAMPLGLDTPSTFGMVFFVLGPAFLVGKEMFGVSEDALKSADPLSDPAVMQACIYTWHIGICSIFISGIFKFACALGSNWIRRIVPRAGLLGSLAAIALVLISFLPLIDVMRYPVVGLVSLAVILTTLVARVHLPKHIPGALAALVIAGAAYYALVFTGMIHREPLGFNASDGLMPTGWLSVFNFSWLAAIDDTLKYLPIVIPFALATVVGGIDCTESAAAAGDEFDTGHVIAVEAFATLVASVCGGVIQTTPYIGHPAYKAMGGRAAYTLATALFVGSAGLFGYFSYMYVVIPKAAIFPILIFVGLEITAQSFHATPKRHYAALALACVPAMAKLVLLFVGQLLPLLGKPLGEISPPAAEQVQTLYLLSGGFVITSLLWASVMASIIDRRFITAGNYFVICAVLTLFGIIHSPFADERLFLPWAIPTVPFESQGQSPIFMAAAYLASAALMYAWTTLKPPPGEEAHGNDE